MIDCEVRNCLSVYLYAENDYVQTIATMIIKLLNKYTDRKLNLINVFACFVVYF